MHEDICTKFAAGISQKNAERIDVFCVVAAAILIDGFFQETSRAQAAYCQPAQQFFRTGRFDLLSPFGHSFSTLFDTSRVYEATSFYVYSCHINMTTTIDRMVEHHRMLQVKSI